MYVNQSKHLLHVTFVSLVGNAYIHVYCDQFVVFFSGIQCCFFCIPHIECMMYLHAPTTD